MQSVTLEKPYGMLLNFLKPDRSQIQRLRLTAKEKGSPYAPFSKLTELDDYSDEDIRAMYNGFYIDNRIPITDGDRVLDLKDVTGCSCVLEDVSYYKKPSRKDYETNAHNNILNIRSFYVNKYLLHTATPVNDTTEHEITGRLLKAGAFRRATASHRHLCIVANRYKSLQVFKQGAFPKDLFHPIKQYINSLFFENDYQIDDFKVKTDLVIWSGK